MKKTICCFLLTCLGSLFLLFPLPGEEKGLLRCGWMLYLDVQEPYKTYINGDFRGITPLLIPGVPAGEFVLRLEGEESYHETKGIANPSQSGLTVYKPVPEKYKGELRISSDPPGAEIGIDGLNVGKTPLVLKNLDEGTHTVSFALHGYREYTSGVQITRTTPASLTATMVRLYTVSFEPPLLSEVTVTCGNQTERLVFRTGDACLLPAGEWQLTLQGEGMVTETRTITVNGDLQLAFSPVLYDPRLVFANLLPGSFVFVDNKDVSGSLADNSFLLPGGAHKLTVRKAAYLDFQRTINVLEDKETLVTVEYIKDPAALKLEKQTAGWITVGAAAFFSIAGLILNWNDVAVGMSSGNYDTYVLLKYGSLGTVGAGLTGIIVGLVLQF